MKDLYPHQSRGIQFIKENRKAILGFCMRAGKTATALLAGNDDQTLLVVCPLTIVPSWQREIAKWQPGWTSQVIRRLNTEIEDDHNVYIVPDSMLSRLWKAGNLPPDIDYLILDEAHRYKSPSAARTYAAVGLMRKAEYVAALSGTIMPNRPLEMWLWVRELIGRRNRQAFEQEFCDGHMTVWGWDNTGASNVEDLAKLMEEIMLTVTAEDLHDTLAEIMEPKLVYLDLPVDHREKDFDIAEILKNPFSVPFEALSDIRHLDGQRKIDPAVEHVELMLETENKIVVWGHHRDVLDELHEKLAKYQPAMIHGGIDDREPEIERFQTDINCRVFIGQINAAGMGITLDAAAMNVVVEAPWVPGDLNQALARCGGPEQKRAVRTDILTISESIDGQVLTAILNKTVTIDTINKDTLMSKKLTKVEASARDLVAALATANKETPLALVHRMFPKYFETTEENKPVEEPTVIEGEVVAAQPEREEPKEVTIADVRSLMAKVIKTKGAEPVKAILAQFKAERLSDVKADSYANMVEVLAEALGE